MNTRFREYVRRTEFNLPLSTHMIGALNILYANVETDNWDFASLSSLERRGLVSYTPPEDESALWDDKRAKFTLTTAGRLVCELLIEAGFFMKLEDRRPE